MDPKYSIVDAFCWNGPVARREPGAPYTIEDLSAEQSKFQIRQRVCFHFESRDGFPDEGNAEMSRLAALHPGTSAVWAALPPRRFHAEPVAALLSRAQAAGVAMFTMYPKKQLHHIASWANAELYSAMEEARLPFAIEMDQISYPEVYDLAKAHPRLPIILWSAGYSDERLQIPILDLCPNVHVGLATRFIPSDGVEQYTQRYGPGRLIFGSGWPVQSPGPLITYVTYATVPDDVKSAVLGGNIRRLLSGVRWKVAGLEGTAS